MGAAIVASHGQKSSEVVFFAFEVSVEQGHIAFSATPEHIALTAQLDCSIYRCLDLVGSVSHNL